MNTIKITAVSTWQGIVEWLTVRELHLSDEMRNLFFIQPVVKAFHPWYSVWIARKFPLPGRIKVEFGPEATFSRYPDSYQADIPRPALPLFGDARLDY